MFPHDGKIVIVYQFTYYEKKTLTASNGVLLFIGSSPVLITTYIEFISRRFKPSILLGTYPIDPPFSRGKSCNDMSPSVHDEFIKLPSRLGTSPRHQKHYNY